MTIISVNNVIAIRQQFGGEAISPSHDLMRPPPLFFDNEKRAKFAHITALPIQPSHILYATGRENALYTTNIQNQPVNLNNNADAAIAGAMIFVGLIGLGILIGGTGGLAVVALGIMACGSMENIGDPVDKDGDGFIDKQFGGDDCDDSDKNIHPGAIEICNGKDDNCDGNTDEGVPERRSYNGPVGTEGVGICKPKIQQCRNGVFVTAQEEVLPKTEICDNKDNNCNGNRDEGIPERYSYNGPVSTEGVGVCKPKIQQCRNGVFVTTQEEVLPKTEICDNKDNDCDGNTDEICWLQIGARDFHTCGVKTDNSVACWGWNQYGQSSPPSGAFLQIGAGKLHTCGVRADNSVACWGNNEYGQSNTPSGSFTQVSAGGYHTCGVKTDNSVACWGNNEYGPSSPPSGAFRQIGAGDFHTCGVKTDNSVACWGWNQHGQSSPPSGAFLQVSAGYEHTCGVKTDNSVACWGYNRNVRPSTPSGAFLQVGAGKLHTCGVKADNSVACWGNNRDGQSSPPSGTFLQVSAGEGHTCGVKADNSVACWGWNQYGQSTPPK